MIIKKDASRARALHHRIAADRTFLTPTDLTMTRRFLMCLAVILVAGSCTNPRVQANIAQALNDVSNELTAQRQDMATLQEQIDSLKHAMVHQDSIIKRLVNVTGIPAGQQ